MKCSVVMDVYKQQTFLTQNYYPLMDCKAIMELYVICESICMSSIKEFITWVLDKKEFLKKLINMY